MMKPIKDSPVQSNRNDLRLDDTPVASARAGPGDGSGDAEDGGDGAGANGRLWRTVIIGEQEHRIDMQVIRPYLRVITHGGECGKRKANANPEGRMLTLNSNMLILTVATSC